jgi:hypothetical protein
MKLNIKLPTDKVLIQNYLQNNSNETSNRSSRSVENNDNLCTNGTDAIWPTDPKTFKFKEIILKALYTLEVDTQFLRFKVS